MQEDREQAEAIALLKKQNTEINNKIKNCKISLGSGDIDQEIYALTIESLQQKLAKNELELAKHKRNLSNLYSRTDEITSTCCILGSLWRKAELEMSEKIQNLLFPNGILWDKEIGNYRTFNKNKALLIIDKISESYKNKKEENPLGNSSSVTLCG